MENTENQDRELDLKKTELILNGISILISIILTIAGIWIGIWQFHKEQNLMLEKEYDLIARNDSLHFKREIFKVKQEAYLEVTKAVGKILSAHQLRSSEKLKSSLTAFDEIYFGQLFFAKDSIVEITVGQFRTAVQRAARERLEDKSLVKHRADALINALKNSLTNYLDQNNKEIL